MGRNEALAALVAALLMVSAGLTWRFGAYGLIGSGALIGVFVALVPQSPRSRGDRR